VNPGTKCACLSAAAAVVAGLAALLGPAGLRAGAVLKAHETVVLFPALGVRTNGGWEIEIRGCVYELKSRRFSAALLRKAVGLDDDEMTPAERTLFRQRARLLLADHKHGERVSVRVAGQTLALGPSAHSGQFQGRVFVPDSAWPAPVAAPKSVDAVVIGSEAAASVPAGPVHLLPERGLSVVSDLDDTIKVSNVRDHRELMRNTFCRPFRPVPGMAELYQKWAGERDARFHYVSASPWQLFDVLREFLSTSGFPAGSLHLRNFRLEDGSVLALWKSPEQYKLKAIEPLLNRFPARQFVLVGDSGERDPEAYAALARRHPQQVVRVLIRDVTGETSDAPRYRRLFSGLPAELWRVFQEPSSVEDALPSPSR